MMNCPHCSKELSDVVSKTTFDERVQKLVESRKIAEEKAAKLEALANQAAPLAARANGFDHDADSLEILQARHIKSGSQEDFASWLANPEGALKDSAALRFRAAPPKAEAAAAPKEDPRPAAAAATPAPSRLPSSPTAQSTPAVTPRYTPDQVRSMNEKLLTEYKAATPERKAAIKTQMEQNRALAENPS